MDGRPNRRNINKACQGSFDYQFLRRGVKHGKFEKSITNAAGLETNSRLIEIERCTYFIHHPSRQSDKCHVVDYEHLS